MAKKYMGRSDVPMPWETEFLRIYSERGGISLSAKEAGTSWQTVKKWAEVNPEFGEKLETAKTELIEKLERQLVRLGTAESKGNFLAVIARLKGEIPGKYNDKLQVSGAIGHLHAPVPQEEIEELLRGMLGAARPSTRAQIRGEVLDGTPAPSA